MKLHPTTPLNPSRPGSSHGRSRSIGSELVTNDQGLASNVDVAHREPTPPATFGDTVVASSPITPGVAIAEVVDDVSAAAAQLKVGDDDVLVKEASGVSVRETAPSGHETADDSPGSQNGNVRSILKTPGSTCCGSTRDPNGQQRGVSFALPADSDDLFCKEGHGKENGGTSALVEAQIQVASPRPSVDQESIKISGHNAQALLPPSSCVFVANLPRELVDDQLEYKVKEKFEAFGNVYVKIKRDYRGMPYAFAQFENMEDANKAIQNGRHITIEGRNCRTERAKVNRSLYLSRTDGGEISENEARMVLKGFGAIEAMFVPTPHEIAVYRLPQGIWVQFAYFQDCRDAQMSFKERPNYRLEQPALPEELCKRGTPFSRLHGSRSGNRSPPGMVIPRASIFVGNLPVSASQVQLRSLFCQFGEIKNVEIVSRVSMFNASSINVFAFIEFQNETAARNATEPSMVPFLEGHRLRVELREGRPPMRSSPIVTNGGTPTRTNTGTSPTMGYGNQNDLGAGTVPTVPYVPPHYVASPPSYSAITPPPPSYCVMQPPPHYDGPRPGCPCYHCLSFTADQDAASSAFYSAQMNTASQGSGQNPYSAYFLATYGPPYAPAPQYVLPVPTTVDGNGNIIYAANGAGTGQNGSV